MTRAHKALPVCLKFKMPLVYHKTSFGFVHHVIRSTAEACCVFGEAHKRVFKQGSYAIIDNNTEIDYQGKDTCITLFYIVYNDSHVCIWPV